MEYPWTVRIRTDLSLVRTHAMSIASGCLQRLMRGVLVMPVAAVSTSYLSVPRVPFTSDRRQQLLLATARTCKTISWEGSVYDYSSAKTDFIDNQDSLLSCVDVGYHFFRLVSVVDPSLSQIKIRRAEVARECTRCLTWTGIEEEAAPCKPISAVYSVRVPVTAAGVQPN